LGLILGTVGEGALSNMPRFTFGMMELQSGFSFITLAMAMFALPEALFLVMNPRHARPPAESGKIDNLRITGAEARKIAPVIGRQSVQGFFIGVLPGGRGDHRLVPGLRGGAQHRQGRGAGGVRQRFDQGACGTGNRQQRRLYRLLCALADAGHSRFRHHGDPSRRAAWH
jgi:hypothetical protein